MISIVNYLLEQYTTMAQLKQERDPVRYSKIIKKTPTVVSDEETKEEVNNKLRKFGGKFIKKFVSPEN